MRQTLSVCSSMKTRTMLVLRDPAMDRPQVFMSGEGYVDPQDTPQPTATKRNFVAEEISDLD